MDKTFVHNRFKEFKLKRKFKSARVLAETLKINRHAINRVLGGDVTSDRDHIVFNTILEQIGVSEEEFFGRSGSPTHFTEYAPSAVAAKVPLYGDIPAGYANAPQTPTEPEEWVEPPPGVRNKNLFALRVSGYSMSPRLLPGDTVYLEKLELGFGYKDLERPAPRKDFERFNGRIVAALVDGDAQLKALKVIPKKDSLDFDLYLVSLNPAFPERYIQPDECLQIQGVTVASCRSELLPVINFNHMENA
jgi:SOS-response transcriptional repressor LexA